MYWPSLPIGAEAAAANCRSVAVYVAVQVELSFRVTTTTTTAPAAGSELDRTGSWQRALWGVQSPTIMIAYGE